MGRDVLGNPFLSSLNAGGERGEHIVGNADHDLNARLSETVESVVVSIEKLNPLKAVVFEKPDHGVWGERVGCLCPPVGSNPAHHSHHS